LLNQPKHNALFVEIMTVVTWQPADLGFCREVLHANNAILLGTIIKLFERFNRQTGHVLYFTVFFLCMFLSLTAKSVSRVGDKQENVES